MIEEKNEREVFDMKNKNKLSVARKLLAMVLIMGTVLSPVISEPKVQAASKAYGSKLKLNNNIKLNKTKNFTKTGIYKENTFYPEEQKINVKYSISCKRKSVGNKYKVTYKVKYSYMGDPKISNADKIWYDDWLWGYTSPNPIYTVFDYKTGMCLEGKNKRNVKVKDGGWKYTYYPQQFFQYTGEIAKDYKQEDCWIKNIKSVKYSFTVTYPKKYKDVVVGIGFVNNCLVPNSFKNEPDNRYWTGKKTPYGKTSYYKKGKSTMSYMRLK